MKRSREYRFEQKERVIKNRLKLIKNTFNSIIDKYDGKLNILNKDDPYDCGKRQCGMCRSCKKQHAKDINRKVPLEDDQDEQ